MSNAVCKTCGAELTKHRPSVFDPHGAAHPDHKLISGNNMAAPEPLANTDAANPPEAIEDKLKEILLEVWGYAYADGQLGQQPEQDDISIALTKLQAIITTETTKARMQLLLDIALQLEAGELTKDYIKARIEALQKEQKQ